MALIDVNHKLYPISKLVDAAGTAIKYAKTFDTVTKEVKIYLFHSEGKPILSSSIGPAGETSIAIASAILPGAKLVNRKTGVEFTPEELA